MKLKQTENMIRLRHSNIKFAEAYRRLFSHYSFVDFWDKTNHCSILNLLYNFPKRKFTLKKIAFLSNVSDSTLLRYRQEYAECFNYFLTLFHEEAGKEIAFTEYIEK